MLSPSMAFSSYRPGLFAALAALSLLPACGAQQNELDVDIDPPATSDRSTLRFEDPRTLTLAPGDVEQIVVLGSPAAGYQISFALLGEPLDAWLDHAAVAAEPDSGRAYVELHAPSQPTTFHLRASVLDDSGAPGASADRSVAVSQDGFGSVAITPIYDGTRPVTEWTASVTAGVTCKDLTATLPMDAENALVETGAPGSPLVVENAPVGPNLAVVVRAGHYAWGCTDTTALTPGGTVKVDVDVLNKKLDLSAVELSAMFRYDAVATALAPIHEQGGALLAEAFLSKGSKVGSVVLNGMQALLPPAGKFAFGVQRINKGWESLAATHFAAQSPGLRQQLELWIAAGLVQQSPSFEGALVSSAKPDVGTLAVTHVGSVEAADAGAEPDAPLTWGTEGDKVLLATSISWQPSRFAGAAALGPAELDFPGASSVADALAQSADCAALATAMGGFEGCDVTCVEQLCTAAIAARFGVALAASQASGELATLSLSASANAVVGDHAEPITLEGHFIGDATYGTTSLSMMGNLSAKTK